MSTALIFCCGLIAAAMWSGAEDVSLRIDTHMEPPCRAVLERRLLAENVPACRDWHRCPIDTLERRRQLPVVDDPVTTWS